MSELSVLIVDDDVDIAANISDILDEFGYATDTAHDGEAALKLAEKHQYDVVLLDFVMPGMDGATLFGHLKKIQPHVVAIMVTGFAGDDGVERATKAGVSEVMSKPVDVAELLGHIKKAEEQPLVLVVDDDEAFCENLWQILREQEFRVGVAYSADEACKQLDSRQFSVVLLDVVLGNQTSETLLSKIGELNPRPSMVIVTGNQEKHQDLIRSKSGARAESVFHKPVEMPKLLETVKRLAGAD